MRFSAVFASYITTAAVVGAVLVGGSIGCGSGRDTLIISGGEGGSVADAQPDVSQGGQGGSAGQGGDAGTGGFGQSGSAGQGGDAGTGGFAGAGGDESGGSGGTGGGGPVEGPSCNGLPKTCGDKGNTSCCSSIEVPGGSFPMGRGGGSDAFATGLADEQPEHEVSVSGFYLDEFEVTVGRFRRFVEKYDEEGTKPKPGAGAHPKIDGSGWKAEWNGELPSTADDLKKSLNCGGIPIWGDKVGETEQHPINCVNWYEAFAFCAWDGGRLPTEAEWEKAAAGGDENRLYPWGSEAPDETRASYGSKLSIQKVGMLPKGQARWEHKDLAGNMWEWVLDWYVWNWYDKGGKTCTDCANLEASSYRVMRGGAFHFGTNELRAAFRRDNVGPKAYGPGCGFRCAKDAPRANDEL